MIRVSSRRALALLAIAATVVACRYTPTPVPLRASATDIALLAGRWEGQYVGGESGRTGTIVFMIQPGKDTAYGDVLMDPERGAVGQPVRAADVETGEHARHSSLPELLRVSLVRVSGGQLEGALEPYIAPDCQCTVTTTFRGALAGNTIKGDYLTTGPYGLRQTGSWSVTRQGQHAEVAR